MRGHPSGPPHSTARNMVNGATASAATLQRAIETAKQDILREVHGLVGRTFDQLLERLQPLVQPCSPVHIPRSLPRKVPHNGSSVSSVSPSAQQLQPHLFAQSNPHDPQQQHLRLVVNANLIQ